MHIRPKLVPVALLLLARAASAQLDLPSGPRPPARDPSGALAPPPPHKGDLAPGGEGEILELPTANALSATAAPAAPAAIDDDQRARQIFLELGAKGAIELVPRTVERLLALGDAGRRAGRAELASASPAHLLAAARTCLRSGDAADRAAVAERLTRAVPSEVAVTLLDDLIAADPVVASPEYLCSLLDHECTPLRHRAVQLLEPLLSPTCVPALAPRLASRRTPTRLVAVDLLARIDDPAATHLLVSRLGDPSAQVASRVASLLAVRAGTEEELLGAAFPMEADGADSAPTALDWNRQRAYAVLALVKCEEFTGTTLLDAGRVPSLLAGLDSALPIVAGSCAVALTAIGYRSPPAGPTGWLDREVPHALVRYGTGAVFHSDFSALATPALRAFGLLTGRSFGSDGEAARGYWAVNAEGFRARRGVIELGPDPTAQLAVAFDDGVDGTWTILGTGLEPRHPEHGCDRARCLAPTERSLFLDQAALERLLARLSSEGVFDVRRPPTLDDGPSGRWLRVEVDGQHKHFSYPGGAEPEWFVGLLSELRAGVSENRWQLFFDPARFHSQRDWWISERERFSPDADPLARRQAFKAVVLERALASSGAERSPFLTELESLFTEVGVPEGRDFAPLIELVRSERGPGPRLETLLGLGRVAAALAREDASATGDKDPVHELFWAGVDRGGEPLRPALERVARDLGPGAGLELAQDVRPFVRSLAPAALAGEAVRGDEGASAARARLVALLSDPDPAVVQATLAAIAVEPFEDARAALTALARDAQPTQRALALRAMGRLKGPDVLDLLLLALAEPEEELQSAAVEALADLGDARSASLCASLLSRGSASPLFDPARRALVRLGPVGEAECLRLARSASARTRREAVLFLAQQGLPEAASLLLTLLTEDPTDSGVAWELAVLSATDLRAAADPVRAWWAWWDLVVQDDALAWLIAAGERAGFPAPPRAQLEDAADARGARFLAALLAADDEGLVERAARELERRLGQPLGRPASARERADWKSEVAAAVEARFGR